MRTALLAAIVAAAALTGCSTDDAARWYDARDAEAPPLAGVEVVDDGTVRVVESTEGGFPCVQVTVRDVTTFCTHHDDAGFGYTAAARRSGDLRYLDLRTGSDAREFVVWSSASPAGRVIEPFRGAGSAILVWLMEPGEEPWGVQIIGADGALGAALSFVGLPGE